MNRDLSFSNAHNRTIFLHCLPGQNLSAQFQRVAFHHTPPKSSFRMDPHIVNFPTLDTHLRPLFNTWLVAPPPQSIGYLEPWL